MNRRNFLAAAVTAPALFHTASAIGQEHPLKSKITILATNWGFEGSVDAFCRKAREAGYDGIEMWWQHDSEKRKELIQALQRHNLQVGFLCGGHQPDFASHLKTFRDALSAAATNSEVKPLYINCHSGKDYFTYEQNRQFIDLTSEFSAKTGLRICHETHRGRMLYSAPIARHFVDQNPGLRLTLDISHWCNVHESLLADQAETVQKALERVDHIHARIGHPQGPQVNDPRAPEWKGAVDAHLKWWDTVVGRKNKSGEPITFLTEFGPPDYFPTLPYSRQPVSNQWEINVYMMNLLRERYQST